MAPWSAATFRAPLDEIQKTINVISFADVFGNVPQWVRLIEKGPARGSPATRAAAHNTGYWERGGAGKCGGKRGRGLCRRR